MRMNLLSQGGTSFSKYLTIEAFRNCGYGEKIGHMKCSVILAHSL